MEKNKEIKDIDKIIKNAKKQMQPMLKSVYDYNSDFLLSKKQEDLLSKILFAMSVVDRKFFVPISSRNYSYSDNALSIGHSQTISQPSTVARMLILSDLNQGDSVLEVGAGSGWNAALISFLVYPGLVVSFDRINALIEQADKNLNNLLNFLSQKRQGDYQKFSKLSFVAKNIFGKDFILKKKYDKIIFTAGIQDEKDEKKIKTIADKLLKQEGILVSPRTTGPMIIYKKQGKLKRFETKEDYVFVPLLE